MFSECPPPQCDCPLPYPAMVCYQTPDAAGPPSAGGGSCADDSVGVPDLLRMLADWGACDDVACLGPTGMCCEWGDLDRDGVVGIADLIILLAWWGDFDRDAWNEFRCQETP